MLHCTIAAWWTNPSSVNYVIIPHTILSVQVDPTCSNDWHTCNTCSIALIDYYQHSVIISLFNHIIQALTIRLSFCLSVYLVCCDLKCMPETFLLIQSCYLYQSFSFLGNILISWKHKAIWLEVRRNWPNAFHTNWHSINPVINTLKYCCVAYESIIYPLWTIHVCTSQKCCKFTQGQQYIYLVKTYLIQE